MSRDFGSATIAIGATATSGVINWYNLLGDWVALLTAIATFILVVTLIRKHLAELRVIEDEERRKKERRKVKREEDK